MTIEHDTQRIVNLDEAGLIAQIEALTEALVYRNTIIDELRGDLERYEHARRDADTLTPLHGSHADIAAHVFDLHVADPGGGQ